MWAGADHEVPFQVTASPRPATATQKVEALHDTELGLDPAMKTGADQVDPAARAVSSSGTSSPMAARMPSAQHHLGRLTCRVVTATVPFWRESLPSVIIRSRYAAGQLPIGRDPCGAPGMRSASIHHSRSLLKHPIMAPFYATAAIVDL
jgi:hypothetical protein